MKRKICLCSLGVLGALFLNGCRVVSSSSVGSSSGSTSNQQSNSYNKEYYGEYKETSFGSTYTTKVKVIVEDNKIKKVEILEGSNMYTEDSSWPGNTVWKEKEEEALKSYEGKSIDEIKESTTIVVDKVAGATLTSNRLYQAIKDALK